MITTKTTKQDGEYRVRLFIDGEYQAGADYFTTDKQDAKDTAAAMVANGAPSDKTTDFAISEQAEYNEEQGEDASAHVLADAPRLMLRIETYNEDIYSCAEEAAVNGAIYFAEVPADASEAVKMRAAAQVVCDCLGTHVNLHFIKR